MNREGLFCHSSQTYHQRDDVLSSRGGNIPQLSKVNVPRGFQPNFAGYWSH
jgi:hypothetical protein